MKEISNFSNQFREKNFYITENDIGDLDIFFMLKKGQTNGKSDVLIVREPVFYFSCSSQTEVKPVYFVGSDRVSFSTKGQSIYAGRLITNAFHNVPLINLLIAADCEKVEDLPPVDLYIVNKKRGAFTEDKKPIFQDCVVENVKIVSWNFEQGVDTPGRFFVCDFFASAFKGIHLKAYLEKQLYFTNGNASNSPDLKFFSVTAEGTNGENSTDVDSEKVKTAGLVEKLKELSSKIGSDNKMTNEILTENLNSFKDALGTTGEYKAAAALLQQRIENTKYLKGVEVLEEYKLNLPKRTPGTSPKLTIKNNVTGSIREQEIFVDKNVVVNDLEAGTYSLYFRAGTDLHLNEEKTIKIGSKPGTLDPSKEVTNLIIDANGNLIQKNLEALKAKPASYYEYISADDSFLDTVLVEFEGKNFVKKGNTGSGKEIRVNAIEDIKKEVETTIELLELNKTYCFFADMISGKTTVTKNKIPAGTVTSIRDFNAEEKIVLELLKKTIEIKKLPKEKYEIRLQISRNEQPLYKYSDSLKAKVPVFLSKYTLGLSIVFDDFDRLVFSENKKPVLSPVYKSLKKEPAKQGFGNKVTFKIIEVKR